MSRNDSYSNAAIRARSRCKTLRNNDAADYARSTLYLL